MTTTFCSIYSKNDTLYIAERIDAKLVFTTRKYDTQISDNTVPSSMNVTLPTDQLELNQYTIDCMCQMYSFEYCQGEPSGYLSYVRDVDLGKDIFLVHDMYIVHVQDITPVDEKMDQVVNELLKKIPYSDHTPESFFALADEALGKVGVDLAQEMEKLVFEKGETAP